MTHHTVARDSSWLEKPKDCWVTPPGQLELIDLLWPEGIDLDPFWDPEGLVKTREHFDIRKGEDAYAETWGDYGTHVFANGPYSGGHPVKTALRCALFGSRQRHILSLCPAAPGSNYWKRWVWPRVNAIAWLGRLSFIAGRDLYDGNGKLTHKQGELVHGNRTEIAMNYQGPEAHTFTELWKGAGFPVSRVAPGADR